MTKFFLFSYSYAIYLISQRLVWFSVRVVLFLSIDFYNRRRMAGSHGINILASDHHSTNTATLSRPPVCWNTCTAGGYFRSGLVQQLELCWANVTLPFKITCEPTHLDTGICHRPEYLPSQDHHEITTFIPPPGVTCHSKSIELWSYPYHYPALIHSPLQCLSCPPIYLMLFLIHISSLSPRSPAVCSPWSSSSSPSGYLKVQSTSPSKLEKTVHEFSILKFPVSHICSSMASLLFVTFDFYQFFAFWYIGTVTLGRELACQCGISIKTNVPATSRCSKPIIFHPQ